MPLPSIGRLSTRANLKPVGKPGNGNGGNTGRHRTVAREQEELLPDTELESYLAALSPENDSPETTGTGKRFGAAQVYQLRLALAHSEQLRELAELRNTSPLALAQEWITQRLEHEVRSHGLVPQSAAHQQQLDDTQRIPRVTA